MVFQIKLNSGATRSSKSSIKITSLNNAVKQISFSIIKPISVRSNHHRAHLLGTTLKSNQMKTKKMNQMKTQFSNIVLDYAGFNPDDLNLAINSSKSKLETSNKFFLYKKHLINIFEIDNSKSS